MQIKDEQIKLIVSDMDGCLLDGNGELPSRFAEALHLMDERGIIFAAASGRAVGGMKRPFGKYADHISFISDNGARVFLNGKCIHHRVLSYEKYLPVIKEMREHKGLLPVACGVNGAWVEHMDDITPEMEHELSKYYLTWKECSFDHIPDEIIKFALLYFDDIEKNIYPFFSRFDDKDICVQVTAFVWIDIFEKGVSKGEGIRCLQKELGISPEKTIVFGDYLNDLPMADHAGRSFAPVNAHHLVKERFTDIIDSNTKGSVTGKIIELLK